MLMKFKTLKDYTLESLDGNIGKVKEFYFDDQYWAVRYLIVDTGNWLSDKQVLISPYQISSVNQEKETISINLTKNQIENSPSLDSDKPVSRQFELSYYGFYDMPTYWDGLYMWGSSPYIIQDRKMQDQTTEGGNSWDPHLRSSHEVSGYHIQASDNVIGHVENFIIDPGIWAIRYLIINTGNWLPGKKILVSTKWIEKVSWSESKIFINLLSEAIITSPEYTDEMLLTRDYETGLHHHYNLHGYWVDEHAFSLLSTI